MGLFSTSTGYFVFSGLHFVCFALALTVCGLYGTDLNSGYPFDDFARSKWVYAVVVGVLSTVTCVVYFLPFVIRSFGFVAAVWSGLLFILWIAVFGVFASLFIHADSDGDSAIRRMRSAVWVDLVNALLWLISALSIFGYWWKHRESRSQFTGRAQV